MQLTYLTQNNATIACVESDDVIISDAQDAGELLMNCRYNGSDNIIVKQQNLPAGFFDLKTGLAGDILQKFSTYRGRLAIIGDFSRYEGKSLQDFIYESNKGRRINFVATFEEAVAVLAAAN